LPSRRRLTGLVKAGFLVGFLKGFVSSSITGFAPDGSLLIPRCEIIPQRETQFCTLTVTLGCGGLACQMQFIAWQGYDAS
jgi:hypothetical protein